MRIPAAIVSTILFAGSAPAEPPRDPFAAYEHPSVAAGSAPLQRWSLEQLRLRGVVVHTASPRALLESPDGESHFARVGDLIGTSWGRIAAIRDGAVVVVEQFRDPIGGLHENRAELRLPNQPAPAQTAQATATGTAR